MTIAYAVRKRIITLLEEKKLSRYRLEKNSAIPRGTIKSLMSIKTAGVNMKTIFALCYGFGISLAEFFDDPIFDYNANIIEY